MKRESRKSWWVAVAAVTGTLWLTGCVDLRCLTGLACAQRSPGSAISSCLWSDTSEVQYSGVNVRVVRSGHDTSCAFVAGSWQPRAQ